MARRILSRELYDLIVEGFRQKRGNASHAARVAGCDPRMARRGWSRGWTRQFDWAIPIRDVIQREIEAARAEQQRLIEAEELAQEKEREEARKYSVEAIREELILSSSLRRNAMFQNSVMANVQRQTHDHVIAKMVEAIQQGNLKEAQAYAKYTKDVSFVVRNASAAAQTAIETERIRVSQPLTIAGEGDDLENATAEQIARDWLDGIPRAISRVQKQLSADTTVRHLPDGGVEVDLPEEAYEETETPPVTGEVVQMRPRKRPAARTRQRS